MAFNEITLPDNVKVTKSKKSFWNVRRAHDGDLPWIVETLVSSRIEDQPLLKEAVSEDRLYKEEQQFLLSLLKLHTTTVLVAHKQSDTNFNIGYIIYTTDPAVVIHQVYVRPNFRNNHIAKHLARKAIGVTDIKGDTIPVTKLTNSLGRIRGHGYRFKLVDEQFFKFVMLKYGEM